MRIRAVAAILSIIAAAAVAAAFAAPSSAQDAAVPDDELRLAAAAWLPERTPGPILTLATPAALLDGLVPPPDAARTDALRALRTAGFVGGLARSHAGVPGRAAVLSWAVRGQTSADAAVLLATTRRALRGRAGTAALTDVALPGVAGGRLLGRAGLDGSQLVVATFAAGPWLYGLQAATGPDGAAPDPAELTALAQQLSLRQPERTDGGGTAGAQPLEVTGQLAADLAAARGAALRPREAEQAAPVEGTVQAARLSGADVAIARFPGGAEPDVFRRYRGSAWVWTGDVGGPGCPRIPAEARTLWGLATTCPARTSVVANAGGAGLDADASPLHGIGMWVWEVPRSGGVAGIIDRAKRYGIRTVYVKSGDGIHYWRQFDRALGRLQAAGLEVCGWQYARGRRAVAEARVAARAITRGADCFVVNAEVEFERMGFGRSSKAQRTARAYMAELRRVAGHRVPIGFTSFAYVDAHARFPYSAFLSGPDAADVNMPQVYWGAFGHKVAAAMRRTAQWNAIYGVPVAPIGGTYERERPTDLRRFRCLAAGYGWAGVSYWSLQHTTARQWPAVGKTRACAAPTASAREYPELRPGRKGDHVLWLQERLRLWGYPVVRDGDYGGRTRIAVQTFQRDRGLRASGVATPVTWALLLERPGA